MNKTEVATLLTLASGFDNRNANQANVDAWASVLEHVKFSDGVRAIRDHYASTDRWVMPSDIRKLVGGYAKDRQTALHTAELPAELELMEDGPEFTEAYLRWVKSGELPQGQLTA